MTVHARHVTLVVLIGAALVTTGWWITRAETVVARFASVERGTVEALVSNTRGGTVNACRRARLAPSVGGTIAALAVHEGDRVAAGQRLLELWNEDLAAQVTLAESEARAASSNVQQACLRAEVASRDAQRLVRLREDKLVPEDRIDQAVTEADALAAACSAARAGAEVARSRIAVARATRERTVIRAPFAGVVAEVNGELGEYLTPSPPGIATAPAVDLIDHGCLYVSAPIDEVDAPVVTVGLVARVSLDAFPGRHFPGTVRRIAPYVRELEKQARTVEVEVELARDGLGALLPGYTADVEIIIDTRGGVLTLPVDALLDGDRVLRYRPADGVLESRDVRIGLRNWQHAEVLEGLAAGDRVALGGGRNGVVAGARVEPEQAAR